MEDYNQALDSQGEFFFFFYMYVTIHQSCNMINNYRDIFCGSILPFVKSSIFLVFHSLLIIKIYITVHLNKGKSIVQSEN